MSPSSAESLKDTEVTATSLYVPISKHGFRLLTVPQGKDELLVTIKVGDGGYPESFDGDYQVDLHNGAQLLEVPSTRHRSPRKIRIDAYSDVRIKTGG